MGKFGVFDKAEDKAVEMMIGEKKSATETSAYLKEQGVNYSPEKCRRIKKDAFDVLVDDQRNEAMADFMLESIKKVTFEFEDIYSKFKGVYEKLESEGSTFEQLIVLRDQQKMLHMALKRLGEYTKGIESIKAQNINVINNSDVVIALQQNQEKWFSEQEPEYQDGKLIFNKPLPEVIDAYNKHKFKQSKSSLL